MSIIPASNFETRKINMNFRFNKGIQQGHLVIKGFGIWDIENKGWVSIGSTWEGLIVPTRYSKEEVAKDSVKDGLYEGYDIIKSI
jgi:hypothetical protein